MGSSARFLTCLVMLATGACAGKSVRSGNHGDTGGDPSTGGTGATSTGGSAGAETGGSAASTLTGGTGGTTSTGGFSGTGTGGRAVCALPPDSGPCDAAVRRYAFDAVSGLCWPFIYGGCEGNGNNFSTATECYALCDTRGPISPAKCESSLDCTAISTDCCGCTTARWDTVVGVNQGRTDQISITKCATVDCDACTPQGEMGWFFGTCVEGYCVASDVRETVATECSADSDCHLRNGLGCCEICAPNVTTLVSVNDDVLRTICPSGPLPCPPCVEGEPRYPTDAHAVCQSGTCGIIWELH